jgi:hypothetical protein
MQRDRPKRKSLRELAGTLTHEDAKEIQKLIDLAVRLRQTILLNNPIAKDSSRDFSLLGQLNFLRVGFAHRYY